MNIHAHIIAWNEERILPFVLDYYSRICSKIFIYDNMSTDSSDEIYRRYDKVEVIKWESEDSMNDDMNRKIKSLGYRNRSRNQNVDWVITCDCDEILYHPNLIEKLQEYKKLFYLNNKESCKIKSKEYQLNNKDLLLQIQE